MQENIEDMVQTFNSYIKAFIEEKYSQSCHLQKTDIIGNLPSNLVIGYIPASQSKACVKKGGGGSY